MTDTDRSDIQKIFDFIRYLQEFKQLQRFAGQTFWKDYPQPERYESNADHTWRMAMILVVISDRLSQPIDMVKAMKILLVHDIPEMIAGDESPLGKSGTGMDSHAFNHERAQKKAQREKDAARKIFDTLPPKESQELYEAYLAYNEQSSFEARVVKAIDRFEGKLQAFEYSQGTLFREHYDFTMKYGVEALGIDPVIEELGSMLLHEFREHYTEFEKI